MTYPADIDPDHPLTPLQAASCTYRIALGPRAGQKVLSLRSLPDRGTSKPRRACARMRTASACMPGCAAASISESDSNACAATSPAPRIANERLSRNGNGQVLRQLKSPWRDGTTHSVMSPLEFRRPRSRRTDDGLNACPTTPSRLR